MADGQSDAADWAARRQRVAKETQRAYVTRVRNGVGDLAPGGAMENDARAYTDPVRFKAELDSVFRETPILAGLSADLPEPGSMMVFDELDTSILIVRTKHGLANAFLNMCTHRGARLADAPCRKNLISCPFHGWSFDLEGAVVGVPEPEAFENVSMATRRLISVPCAEWAGMIFIKPRAGTDEINIAAHLGDFAAELEQMELHNAIPIKSGRMDAACNWKYALDTYGEGYHFPTLHKETVALISRTEMRYEGFGRHHRVGWASKDFDVFADKPESDWPDPEFGGVHYLFPNTIIFYGGVAGCTFVQIFRHFPDDVGTMHTNFAVYGPDGVPDEAYRRLGEEAGYNATAHVVDTEDYWVARNGWARLKSAPPGFKVLYGANEWALQEQHKAIAEAAGMPLDMYD